ncbi:MAG: hypothetical protein U5R48_12125 [Gammaproteobacteria bacterium]|nr:hypothetical protein [Gammaproteobacteria bacterium]
MIDPCASSEPGTTETPSSLRTHDRLGPLLGPSAQLDDALTELWQLT